MSNVGEVVSIVDIAVRQLAISRSCPYSISSHSICRAVNVPFLELKALAPGDTFVTFVACKFTCPAFEPIVNVMSNGIRRGADVM